MARIIIHTPPVASSDRDLDLVNLSRFICQRRYGGEAQGHGLGGDFGYGADYENSVFLMHRFCWCEQDSCPWCAGCSGVMQEDSDHKTTCYYTALRALRAKHGDNTFRNVEYERERTALCVARGLDPKYGCEVHCDCGADKAWRKRLKACGCDFHKGRGPWRFGPATGGPNFWHKPSGVMLTWYKWIGRGMEWSRDVDATEWRRIYAECVASIEPAGTPQAPGSGG